MTGRDGLEVFGPDGTVTILGRLFTGFGMARRRKQSRSSKLDSVMTMVFPIEMVESGVNQTNFIDISQCASILNRRFYRQGLEWAVAGFTFVSTPGVVGSMSISKLPDTWMSDNGYTKAYHAWKRQQDDAIEEAGAESAVAKFRDFKISMSPDHVDNAFTGNMLPLGFTAGVNTGEWERSKIVVPNITPDASGSEVDPGEFVLHMCGVNDYAPAGAQHSRGIIEGYADSRAYPHSPDPVSPALDSDDNWLRAMFDVGNDSSEIVDNATDTNDDLPYDQVNYPGGETITPTEQLHDITWITGTTIGGKTSIPGSNFKCGLIRVDTQLTGQTYEEAGALFVHLVPGSHRGYLAERLT